MNTNQCDIGLIGLGVMGENLVLNMESKGFSVAVFNRTTEVTEKFAAGRAQGKNIRPARTLEEFVGALKKPRIAMMMVKAGQPVDSVIGQLAPLLEKGDVIIDGGNSLFTDTQRRGQELESTGIHFVGMGVSGGEEGALPVDRRAQVVDMRVFGLHSPAHHVVRDQARVARMPRSIPQRRSDKLRETHGFADAKLARVASTIRSSSSSPRCGGTWRHDT